MFILRSAFWLGLALVVVHPGGVDLPKAAGGLTDAALKGGQQIAAASVSGIICVETGCGAGALALNARNAISQAGSSSRHDDLVPAAAPMPMPRLVRKG